jgi:IS30 family transposase
VGDWEGDTIVAKDNAGAIVSLVERHSKLTKLFLVSGRNSAEVTAAIIKMLSPIAEKVKTITFDNGKEFSQHKGISEKLKADIYFARPYHSWERGLNEYTNALIRQYCPKSTKFVGVITMEGLQAIEDKLNNRPGKVLGYRTPQEVFDGLCHQLFF